MLRVTRAARPGSAGDSDAAARRLRARLRTGPAHRTPSFQALSSAELSSRLRGPWLGFSAQRILADCARACNPVFRSRPFDVGHLLDRDQLRVGRGNRHRASELRGHVRRPTDSGPLKASPGLGLFCPHSRCWARRLQKLYRASVAARPRIIYLARDRPGLGNGQPYARFPVRPSRQAGTAGHHSRHSGRLWPPLHESRDAASRRRLATGLPSTRSLGQPRWPSGACRHGATGLLAAERHGEDLQLRGSATHRPVSATRGTLGPSRGQTGNLHLRAFVPARANPVLARQSPFDTRRLCTGGGSPPGPAGSEARIRLPALSMGPTRRPRFKFLNLSP